MAGPGESAGSFERPGQFVVVSSLGGAQLHIVVRAANARLAPQAQLEIHRIDKLLPGIDGAVAREVQPAGDDHARYGGIRSDFVTSGPQPFDDDGSDFGLSIVGHVAHRGNVVAAPGTWVAGPNAPAPIEGLFFQLKPSAALWFEAQVLMSGQQAWTTWTPATQFVGTQGKGLPLVGVRFRLSHLAPQDLEMEASALFLGSSVIKRAGRQIELRSAAGGDPLIGLRFEAHRKPKFEPLSETRRPDAIGMVPKTDFPARGRVRVFRAGIEQTAN